MDAMMKYEWDLVWHLGEALRVESLTEDPPKETSLGRRAVQVLNRELGLSPRALANLDRSERLEAISSIISLLVNASDVHPSPRDEVLADKGVQRARLKSEQLAFWDFPQIAPTSERARRLRWQVQHSGYPTPPEVAWDISRAILKFAPRDRPLIFGDPAVGSGVFYGALRAAAGTDYQIGQGFGYESDPGLAGRAALEWSAQNLAVTTGDFLVQQPKRGSWDILLANPPYKRASGDDERAHLRSELLKETGIELQRRSDLWMYFLLRSHSWLSSEGLAAWLIPAHVLYANSGRALREYLSTKVNLLRIHVYHPEESLFDHARVASVAVIYRKVQTEFSSEVTFSAGGSMIRPNQVIRVPQSSLERLERWTEPFLRGMHLGSTGRDRATVGDFFRVRRGVATGANDIFILSHERIQELDVPPHLVRSVVPRRRFIDGSVFDPDRIEIDAIVPYWVIDTPLSLEQLRHEVSPSCSVSSRES